MGTFCKDEYITRMTYVNNNNKKRKKRNIINTLLNEEQFVINHYSGSWESYSARPNDSRIGGLRTYETWYEKSTLCVTAARAGINNITNTNSAEDDNDNDSTSISTSIVSRPWLKGFVDQVGGPKIASFLLQDSGQFSSTKDQANQNQNNNHTNNSIDDRWKSKYNYTQASSKHKQKNILLDNNSEEEEEEEENGTTEDEDEDEDGGEEEEEDGDEENDATEDENEDGGEEEEEEIKLIYEHWNHTKSTIDIPNELRPPFSFVGSSSDIDTTSATFKLTSLEILQSVLHGEENEEEYLAVEEYIQTNYSLPTTTSTIPQCLIPNKIATRELANEFVLQNKKPNLPVLNVGLPKMGTTTLVSYINTYICRG
jgi:hypothetical protein